MRGRGVLFHIILGPCRCQACGREVVWAREGLVKGWLHPNGNYYCGRDDAYRSRRRQSATV